MSGNQINQTHLFLNDSILRNNLPFLSCFSKAFLILQSQIQVPFSRRAFSATSSAASMLGGTVG